LAKVTKGTKGIITGRGMSFFIFLDSMSCPTNESTQSVEVPLSLTKSVGPTVAKEAMLVDEEDSDFEVEEDIKSDEPFLVSGMVDSEVVSVGQQPLDFWQNHLLPIMQKNGSALGYGFHKSTDSVGSTRRTRKLKLSSSSGIQLQQS